MAMLDPNAVVGILKREVGDLVFVRTNLDAAASLHQRAQQTVDGERVVW